MRASLSTRSILALVALGLVACKGDDGDSSTSTSAAEAHCSAGWGDGPEVDPDYPPCGCDATQCDNGGTCRVSGWSPEWTSSLCQPTCSCTDPNDKDGSCGQNDCPTLGELAPFCDNGLCVVYCDDDQGCPPGYACGDNTTCQVKLE